MSDVLRVREGHLVVMLVHFFDVDRFKNVRGAHDVDRPIRVTETNGDTPP